MYKAEIKCIVGLTGTVEPVYYGHLETSHKWPRCPDYLGVLISRSFNMIKTFGIVTKCVDYAGILMFKCPD